MKKKTLTKEEHQAIGDSLRKVVRELKDHYILITETYGPLSKESKLMYELYYKHLMNLFSELSNRWSNEGISDSLFDNPYGEASYFTALKLYYIEDKTLKEIASILYTTRERASQIIRKGLSKLKSSEIEDMYKAGLFDKKRDNSSKNILKGKIGYE